MDSRWLLICAASLLLTSSSIAAQEDIKILSLQPQSDDEAFFVRRIAEFWKDKDYNIVQSQILTFLEKYPDSSLKDHLNGILGDLYLQKNQYDRALTTYNEISDRDVVQKILINKMQCLYELNQFEAISKVGEAYLSHPTQSIESRRQEYHFLMAESFFKRSLTTDDAEAKEVLAMRAKPLYESLEGTPYADISRFALAEIYRVIGDYPESVRLYLSLAQDYTDQKEELLFHAANLQAQFKPEKAIDTFTEIITMDGERAKEATFNRLLLFYQLGHHHEVIEGYDHVASMIPDDKKNTFDLILGKSYFSIADYPNAVSHLTAFEKSEKNPTPSLKNTLLMLMTASYHQGDQALFNQSFERFKADFPNDPELAKAIFTHAMLAKAADDREKVKDDLELLLTEYPDYEDQEGLVFEYASLTYDAQEWDKCYDSFQNFLKIYPDSERSEIAWRYFFSACLNLYKEAQVSEDIHYSRNRFYNDLSTVLDHENILGEDEQREYRLLQSKIAFELDLFDVAYRKIETYLKDYSDDPSIAEAHYIAGLASKEVNHDLQPVCLHLEKALLLNPEMFDTAGVHLELYNAYLTLSSLTQDQDSFLCKAALHLYKAIDLDTQPIKAENKLWLANYFYETGNKTKDSDEKTLSHQRAFQLLKTTVTVDDAWTVVEINEDSLFIEGEVLKLADLLDQQGLANHKRDLLKSLAAQQNSHPSWDWRLQRRALLELAKAHESLGDEDKALQTYSFIAETAKYSPSELSYVALLKEARLRFQKLDPASRTEDNDEMRSVLYNLKELQIKKQASTEPIHLEAAIDYAKMRADLSPKNERADRHMFFLTRLKEDFSPTDDINSQNYYTTLQEDPEKNHLFHLHMRYVDAQIALLEAEQALAVKSIESAKDKALAAKRLVEELESDQLTSAYLREQVEKTKQDLASLGI